MSGRTDDVGDSILRFTGSVKSKLVLMSSGILVSTDKYRGLTTPRPTSIAQSRRALKREEFCAVMTDAASGFFERW
jgi:hypothetical protein